MKEMNNLDNVRNFGDTDGDGFIPRMPSNYLRDGQYTGFMFIDASDIIKGFLNDVKMPELNLQNVMSESAFKQIMLERTLGEEQIGYACNEIVTKYEYVKKLKAKMDFYWSAYNKSMQRGDDADMDVEYFEVQEALRELGIEYNPYN